MEGQVELYAFLCSAISVSVRFILRRNASSRPTRWIMKLDMDTIPAIFTSETPVHFVTAISEPNFTR